MNLHIEEHEEVNKLAGRLTIDLHGDLFKVQMGRPLYGRLKTIYTDIVVDDVNGKTIIVFEFKKLPQIWVLRQQMDSSLFQTLKEQEIRFYVITDGVKFYVLSYDKKEFLEENYNDIIERIKRDIPRLGEKPSLEDIKTAIVNASDKVGLKQINSILKFIEKKRMHDMFKMDSNKGRIEFSTASIEDAFFACLLNGRIPKKLCRYTTRNNLFLLLKSGKQNMCSIVCMNDKSEETYADKMIGTDNQLENSQLENNDCFILSMLPQEKKDDLTMWRLYGDDAKGVCIGYQMLGRQRNRKIKKFYISRISYGKNADEHPELDFLREMLQLDLHHWRFHLNRWFIWKHFFKSFRFKDEEEVRLLYISEGSKEEKKWIENPVSGIVSKMLLFQMKSSDIFPLCLTDVIVGPKAPEPKKIAEQFNYFVNQEWSDSPILIHESNITEYR